MRVAYVQDWFTVDGGAEKVTREILRLFPGADLFSLVDFMDDEVRADVLGGKKGKTSFIQHLPMARKAYRWYLPLFPKAIESLKVDKYDLIISSSYSVAKGIRTNSNQKHLCYCHSPIRYAHDLKNEYLRDLSSNKLIRWLMNLQLERIARWDISTSERVDCYIANSGNVQERIARLYGRKSEVIYPPVDLSEFHIGTKTDYYLASSRQVAYKRTDIIIEAFKQMPDKKLIVTGNGPELQYLKKLGAKSENILIKGQVPREELIELMTGAKAFINASNEDLGLSIVEALASGTPIIAFKKGGALETTEEGVSAVYFDQQESSSVMVAVNQFERIKLADPKALREKAEAFGAERFQREFKDAVNLCLVS